MENDEKIIQNILNSEGEIVEKNVFSIESLNSKIIPTSILKNNIEERWKNSPSSNLSSLDLQFKKDNKMIREEWREYQLMPASKRRGKYREVETLHVSNLGRVKINNDVAMQEDKQGFIGYLIIKNYPAFGMAWNLVASTWLEKPHEETIFHVHHITNNGYDNSVWNLIWLNNKTHSKINHRIRN